MGGEANVLAEGQRAFNEGDYRWAARVSNQLIFANPNNREARTLLANTHRQMAYQAESAIWRNMYLVAARELESGPPQVAKHDNPKRAISSPPRPQATSSISSPCA